MLRWFWLCAGLAVALVMPGSAAALGSTVQLSEDGVQFAADVQRQLGGLPVTEPGPADQRYPQLVQRAAGEAQPSRAAGQVVQLRAKTGLTRSALGGAARYSLRVVPGAGAVATTFEVGWSSPGFVDTNRLGLMGLVGVPPLRWTGFG